MTELTGFKQFLTNPGYDSVEGKQIAVFLPLAAPLFATACIAVVMQGQECDQPLMFTPEEEFNRAKII